MADFALLALPGAYLGSVGALTDCFGLARGRVEQMFAGPDRLRMQTRLHRLSADGAPVVLADGMVMVGISEFWQMVIKGAVIVTAVVLDRLQERLG